MISSYLKFGLGVVYIALLTQQSHSSGNDCVYASPSGKQIDLSPLNLKLGYKVDSEKFESYSFYVNVCGAIGYSSFGNPEICPQGKTGSCEVQEVAGSPFASELYGQSTNYSIMHQDGTGSNIPAGAMLTYTADECTRCATPKPVTTNIFFECNADAHEPIATMIEQNYWECFLHVKIETSLVCELYLYECDSTTEQCVDVAPGSGFGILKEDCEKTCAAALTLSPTSAAVTTTRAATAGYENNQQLSFVGAIVGGVVGTLAILVVVVVVVLVFRKKIMTQAKKTGASAYNELHHDDKNNLQTPHVSEDSDASDDDDQVVADIDEESHEHDEQIEVESTA